MHDFIYKTHLYNVDEAHSFDHVRRLHKNGQINYPTSRPCNVPAHLFDIMMSLLQRDPHQRASIDSVCTPSSMRYIGMFYNYPRMNHATLQRAWQNQQSMAYNVLGHDIQCEGHHYHDKIRSIALSLCDRFVYASGKPCTPAEARACACLANTLITAVKVSVDGDTELHDAIVSVLQTLRCRII